jgi:uncharacterized SAM-binding protein YcdF (DUF218 family)
MYIIDDITRFIFVEDEPREADIIFIPGGSFPELPEKAAELYRAGYAPLLLPSGGFSIKTGSFPGSKSRADIYNGDYQTECDFYTDVLIKNGVPASAIIREDKSTYTKQNALFSRNVADENRLTVKRAIICCKNFHARRCLMYYQFAFPNTELLVVPAEVRGINRHNWFLSEYAFEQVMGELARCGNQLNEELRDYIRDNVNV